MPKGETQPSGHEQRLPGELTSERANELMDALDKEKVEEFLNSINSVEELEQVRAYLKKHNIKFYKREGLSKATLEPFGDDVDRYEKWVFDKSHEELEEWRDAEKALPDNFRSDFPLISQKLDTPQKIRIFLRGARFCDVSPKELATIAEDIIKRHEAGETVVTKAKINRTYEILAYYTQGQAEDLRELLFPGLKSSGGKSGGSGGNTIFFSWSKEKKNEQQ